MGFNLERDLIFMNEQPPLTEYKLVLSILTNTEVLEEWRTTKHWATRSSRTGSQEAKQQFAYLMHAVTVEELTARNLSHIIK